MVYETHNMDLYRDFSENKPEKGEKNIYVKIFIQPKENKSKFPN